ncbi:MAG: hypothetical protein H7Z17_17015, partial [Fuerstia sp.]|nr:hypothetical protein [Fuerstiella sp.]
DMSNVDPGVIEVMNQDSRRMILEGTHWQPLLGLLIQNQTNSPEISELATTLASDASKSVDLRAAALQFQLTNQPETTAKQSAVSMLASDAPKLASIALKYLSLGTGEITTGPGGFHVRTQTVTHILSSDEMPAPVPLSPPEGLTIESLQPFLETVNAEDAAYASHLMALLNNFDQVPRLIDHWRSNPDDDAAQKLLYQAITVSNDPRYIPVLEEQYAAMSRLKRSANMSDFYWTIRSMTGPEILALRKRIREEQGADQLKQR